MKLAGQTHQILQSLNFLQLNKPRNKQPLLKSQESKVFQKTVDWQTAEKLFHHSANPEVWWQF